MSDLNVIETNFRGLYTINLAVHADSRGSFREAYQAEKLEKLGLPILKPVQWNISDNLRPGIIRGIHAEPWDKYIHVPAGSVFNAVTDLRPESPTFGQCANFMLNRTNALYISRGFGNAYQALEVNTVYCYLVNAHWSAGIKYPSIRYDDSDLNIAWPITPGSDDVSEKDRRNPSLRQTFPKKFPSLT